MRKRLIYSLTQNSFKSIGFYFVMSVIGIGGTIQGEPLTKWIAGGLVLFFIVGNFITYKPEK